MGRRFKWAIVMLAGFVIGPVALRGLHAQDHAAPPDQQINSNNLWVGPTVCDAGPSAACRRYPRSRSLSVFDGDFIAVIPLLIADAGGSLRVEGDSATAVRVNARQTTITNVLDALASAFNVRYRSSIALDEVLDGTYAGSLGYVISRVLSDYNYVIKYQSSGLDVVIFGMRSERAAATPLIAFPIRRGRCGCPVVWPPTLATRLSHQNRCPCDP
jgi:hypothetical protein